MGYRSRKRNIRKFWNNPLVNLCYVLAILALVAGLFGLAALLGKADTLVFSVIMLVLGVIFIILGKKLNSRKNDTDET